MAASGFAERFVLKGGDHSLKAPPGEADGSDAEFLPAHPHTFAAEDTFVRIVGEEGTAFIDREASLELSESFGYELDADISGNLLEFAGSVLLAVTAVHRVTCQDKLCGGACES